VANVGFLHQAKQYFQPIGRLGHNARLYLLAACFQGLSSGIWGVIFYLYLNLRSIGFEPNFISNLFTAGAVTTGLIALPAGLFCELTGPKKALLIGLVSNFASLAQIIFLQPSILLFASFASSVMGTIYGIAGAPFMVENSDRNERAYLFSFNLTLTVIMSVVGSYLGGVMPDLLNASLGLPTGTQFGSRIGYRLTLAISVLLASSAAIPLFLVKEKKMPRQKAQTLLGLRNIKSYKTIVKFMIPTALIGFGAGFIVPLINLFFKIKFHASAEQVGVIFALGSTTLGGGALVAPFLSARLGKVRSVAACQFLSLPFIILIPISPNLTYGATAYILRTALMNMSGPIGTMLQMELVSDTERATTSGFMTMADNLPRAATASVAGQMLTERNFVTPFLITTIVYPVAASLYYVLFRKIEKTSPIQQVPR
jgi:MFS family permease